MPAHISNEKFNAETAQDAHEAMQMGDNAAQWQGVIDAAEDTARQSTGAEGDEKFDAERGAESDREARYQDYMNNPGKYEYRFEGEGDLQHFLEQGPDEADLKEYMNNNYVPQ
mgnify:CR=1 FL=1